MDRKTLFADEALINWLFDESGISVYKISKKTGISRQTLYNLVNGDSLIENITFGNAATLTEYAETIKNNEEDNKMKTWQRDGYHIEERPFDYDLHKLTIVIDDEDFADIIPSEIEDFEQMAADLDNGEDVDGWADGQGGEITLPCYKIDTEDNDKAAQGKYAIVEIMTTPSKKEAYKTYETMTFDKGHTLILSKVNPDGLIEWIAERSE